MMDKIISEDLEKIKNAVKRDVFAGKKVLVTGGAGFIGSWLCDVLIGFDAEVTAVDDLSTGRTKNIDHLTKTQSFKFIKSDVCAFESKEKFNFIFHMAGHASPDEYQAHPIETLQTSALRQLCHGRASKKMRCYIAVCFNFRSLRRHRNYPDTRNLLGKSQPYWAQIML